MHHNILHFAIYSIKVPVCLCVRINTPRKQGGLGHMKVPLVADTKRSISQDYGVLKEDEGIAYRCVMLLKCFLRADMIGLYSQW